MPDVLMSYQMGQMQDYVTTHNAPPPSMLNKRGLSWFASVGPLVITSCFDFGEHKLSDTERRISHFIIWFQSLTSVKLSGLVIESSICLSPDPY